MADPKPMQQPKQDQGQKPPTQDNAVRQRNQLAQPTAPVKKAP